MMVCKVLHIYLMQILMPNAGAAPFIQNCRDLLIFRELYVIEAMEAFQQNWSNIQILC